MRDTVQQCGDMRETLLVDDPNLVNLCPGQVLIDQEFGLSSPLAVTIFNGVSPVCCLHQCPINPVQICKIVKEEAICSFGMPIGKGKGLTTRGHVLNG